MYRIRLRLGGGFCAVVLTGLGVSAQPVEGQIDARLMRQADVSATQIAFVYAGDIWVAPKLGGTAVRLSSPRGEESFPRFSPDGEQIAFTGNYDGNQDVYVVPAGGGTPRRLTHHGAPDRVLDWYPDGRWVLFATSRTSEKDRFNHLYRVSVDGGVAEKLPVPYGEFASLSPDGRQLVYTPISRDFRTWKRYRGGMAPDIWLFDLETLTAENLTRDEANDAQPMWHRDTIYFLSDRGEPRRANIWAYDLPSREFRQVTRFTEFDVHFPGMGPEEIVLENGGQLYLLELASETLQQIRIRVVTDRATLKPRVENVAGLLRAASVSPGGKRVVFEARGELFSVPAEHGFIRNLTHSPGVAERHPAWSPDGVWVAFFSDRTGEYELTLRRADGSGGEETVTELGPGFRYAPTWSPDSRSLVFIDQAMKIHLHDRETRTTRQIDQMLWQYHGGLSRFRFSWSADSRWLAYAADLENRHAAIVLYDTRNQQRHQVTSGFYNDEWPVFDPAGNHLYYRTSRSFTPVYSDLDNTWIYPNTTRIAAVPLRRDVASLLAPRNDEEPVKDPKAAKRAPDDSADKADENEDKPPSPDSGIHRREAGDVGGGEEPQRNGESADDEHDAAEEPDEKKSKTDAKTPGPVEIDLEGFERRAVLLPPEAGRYAELEAVKGKLLFRRLPRAGVTGGKSPVLFWDHEKREEKTILEDADGYELAANGERLLARKGTNYAIVEIKEGQKLDKPLNTSGLEALVDPVLEWRQIFADAWRFQRDYFYDPGLHGVDWPAMREQYSRLLADAVTRWDVNHVIGELIGELNASHTYRSGGDLETAPTRNVGYLGVDFAFENGAFRIQRILEGAPWDLEARSPLREPGLEVNTGDYLLAVNGRPLAPGEEPYAAFYGLGGRTVLLTLNDQPSLDGAREVVVDTLESEARLRHLAWIEANRRRVEVSSDGRLGYVYVPDTGQNGQNELVRQFRSQIGKEGLIIDERFNSGGQIPDRFVELLNRPLYNYWGVRDGLDWPWPPVSHAGPKAMLINGWSGSGGDCFPFYFQRAGLGPLIGTRTWGGLIGMTGTPPLVDGGSVTVPTFGIYSTEGEWIIEGYGVDPDLEVIDDPGAMARGEDPQLDRAVQELLRMLQENPPRTPGKPRYPDRAH
jgi:tricorn protease